MRQSESKDLRLLLHLSFAAIDIEWGRKSLGSQASQKIRGRLPYPQRVLCD